MGSSQSARKLTIDNEEGVIQISNDLVQRLTQNSQQGTAKETVDEPQSKMPTRSFESPKESKTFKSTESPASEGHPGYAYPEYTITAYKMLQQQENELQEQEKYWQERLAKLKTDNDRINNIFEEEYKRAMDEVMSAPGTKHVNLGTAVLPCMTEKDKIIQCYQTNPKEILNCAGVVKQFSNCVEQHRAQIISSRS